MMSFPLPFVSPSPHVTGLRAVMDQRREGQAAALKQFEADGEVAEDHSISESVEEQLQQYRGQQAFLVRPFL